MKNLKKTPKPILYLGEDQAAEILRGVLTDLQWQSLDVRYGEETSLIKDGMIFKDSSDILIALSNKKKTILTLASTFLLAMFNYIKNLFRSNRIKITKQEKKQRQLTCGDCPHNKKGVCSLCGCIVKYKTQLATEKCPIDKW